MKILVYSNTTSETVDQHLGHPEYSYYFVLKEFFPILEQLGEPVLIRDPEHEVDALFEKALAEEEPCIFLSFSPPHKTVTGLRCPTIPVFAWEFDTIPTEPWGDNPRNDWRLPLRELGRAITHSEYAAAAVHTAMGRDFPVLSIPAPVWDKFTEVRPSNETAQMGRTIHIKVEGEILDSREIDFANFDPLTLEGPDRVLNYEYAVSVIGERDAQLQQRNADCAYAESIVRERDAQLEHANAERAYAESIVKERDAQLEQRNTEFAHAEAVVRERDAELLALRDTATGKFAQWLLDKKRARQGDE